MSRAWFVNRDGKSEGPFDLEAITSMLRAGELNGLDRLFETDDVRWRLVTEFQEFKVSGAIGDSLDPESKWILLKRTIGGDLEVQPSGPFTTDYITMRIKSGSIQFSDYVWRRGFRRWARLETLPEFNHKLPPNTEPEIKTGIDTEVDAEALLAAAFALQAPPAIAEIESTKVNFPTLTDASNLKVPAAPESAASSSIAPAESVSPKVIRSDMPPATPAPKSSKLTRLMLASSLSLLAAATILKFKPYLVSAPENKSAAEIAHEPGDNNPKPYDANQLDANARAPASAKKSATPRLEIVGLKLDSEPQLVFQTNAPIGTKIRVQLWARSGAILELPSYNQVFEINRSRGELPSLNLAALKLPQGTYGVIAKFDGVQSESQIFIGKKTSDFAAKLEAHAKRLSAEQQLEKRTLFSLAAQIEDLARKLDEQAAKSATQPLAWAQAYTKWKKDLEALRSYGLKPMETAASEQAYPATVSEARSLLQALSVQGESINQKVLSRRMVSNDTKAAIITRAKAFKSHVATLSSR